MKLLFQLATFSVLGTVSFLLLWGVSPLTRRWFSAAWHYYAGLIPAAFLLGLSVVTTPMIGYVVTLLKNATPQLGGSAPPLSPLQGVTPPVFQEILQAVRTADTTATANLNLLASGLILLWVVGVIVFLLVKLIHYRRFSMMILRVSEECVPILKGVRLVKSAVITSPMLMGILKPVIVLPDVEMSDEEREVILDHELVHLKRGDLLVKLIVLIVNALHWFNPAAYLLARQINLLCETACDEKLVSKMDTAKKQFYGQTILCMLERGKQQQLQRIGVGLCKNKNKKNMERRLLCIMQFKKVKKPAVVVAVIAATVLIGTGSVVAYAYSPLPQEIKFNSEGYDSSSADDKKLVLEENLDKVLLVEKEESTESETESITWITPVKYKRISNKFGLRNEEKHDGIDFAADEGTDIVAAADGTVTLAKTSGIYGRLVKIGHGDSGYETWYAHCSKLLVKSGDMVKQGDVIAKVGTTGRSTGNHLHFEVRENDVSIDPMTLIQ